MAQGKAAQSEDAWRQFARAYQAEMNQGEADKVLNVMAALSKTTHFSMGCYCEDESRCHRSILRDLLLSRGACSESDLIRGVLMRGRMAHLA
jgi:uncharacterized protein YeaO (DUF488 family)